MAKRGILLVTLIAVAIGIAACGRASQAEIEQALGITPTATASAADLSTASAAAAQATFAAETAVAAAAAGAQQAALGDVTRGSRQFLTQCSGCHRVGGAGPDLLSPGSAGAAVTVDILMPLIREGIGHPVPPGPYPAPLLSDGAIADLAAYIASEAGA